MGVVKANAYGHGLETAAQTLVRCGADELGVAFLEEGIALRRAGVRCPILVLGGIIDNDITHFLRHDLMLTASSKFKVGQIQEVAAAMNVTAKVHLKIDTGMGRIGVRPESAPALFDAALSAPNLKIEGVFSHFAAADAADPAFTALQLQRFHQALAYFPDRGLPTPTRHIANSAGILQHPDSHLDMVRPGIMLYGIYPSASTRRAVPLAPALTLKSRVVYFKVAQPGDSISYGGTWRCERPTRIVTLPVGYGDGFFRGLSNHGEVLIHGQRCPIVGAITMDALMVDIGQGSAYVGDEAVLIGTQGEASISVEAVAEQMDTLPYEVLTHLNARIPRVYRGLRPTDADRDPASR